MFVVRWTPFHVFTGMVWPQPVGVLSQQLVLLLSRSDSVNRSLSLSGRRVVVHSPQCYNSNHSRVVLPEFVTVFALETRRRLSRWYIRPELGRLRSDFVRQPDEQRASTARLDGIRRSSTRVVSIHSTWTRTDRTEASLNLPLLVDAKDIDILVSLL